MKQQKIIYQTQPTKIVFGLFFRSIIKSGVSNFFSGKKKKKTSHHITLVVSYDAALYFSVLLFYCSTKLQFAKISFTQECFPKRGACHLQILATGCIAVSLLAALFYNNSSSIQSVNSHHLKKKNSFTECWTYQYKNENILEIA